MDQWPLRRAASQHLEVMMKGSSGVGFSDATGAAFELRVALPGVGEALKREIVGLVWVDRLLLWGFAQCVCFRPELTGQFGGAH
jgi:hypothetical protein